MRFSSLTEEFLRSEYHIEFETTRMQIAQFAKITLIGVPLLFGVNLQFVHASDHQIYIEISLLLFLILGIFIHFRPKAIPSGAILSLVPYSLILFLIVQSVLMKEFLVYTNFVSLNIFLMVFYLFKLKYAVALMLSFFSILAVVYFYKDFDDSLILWNLNFGSIIITGLVVRQAITRIKALAETDALTGLFNRRYSERQFDMLLSLSQRHNLSLTAVYIDVDDFKIINDTLGHNRGDEVLIEIANGMRNVFRKSDILARWGGDEFVVILPKTNAEFAAKSVTRLQQAVTSVGLSCGIVEHQDEENIDQFLSRADHIMYDVKQQKKKNRSAAETEAMATQ